MPSEGHSVTTEEVDDLTRAICVQLKEHRLAQGLSVNRLAQMAGLNETAVRRIENHERMPSVPTAIRLTKALGLVFSQVVIEAENP